MLPEGFRYLSLGWWGDPMENGAPTPGLHDGMAAMHWQGHRIRIVRNHEQGTGTPFGNVAYDAQASGGTTTIEFDQKAGEYITTMPSLSGLPTATAIPIRFATWAASRTRPSPWIQ